MQYADLPRAFPVPWANGAGPGYIREVPIAPPVEPGAASIEGGFPPLNFIPVAAGGIPPFGQDMNGVLNQATAWARWVAAGAPVKWSSSFAAAIGGYPQGAYLQSDTLGTWYLCLVDDNLTNPNTGGADWLTVTPPTPDRLLYFGCF